MLLQAVVEKYSAQLGGVSVDSLVREFLGAGAGVGQITSGEGSYEARGALSIDTATDIRMELEEAPATQASQVSPSPRTTQTETPRKCDSVLLSLIQAGRVHGACEVHPAPPHVRGAETAPAVRGGA